MTNEYVNKLILGNETLFDISGDTVTAADVAQGKTFHLASGAPAVGTASGGGGVDARWWGGIEPELIGETLWSKSPTEAYNWPITPSTSSQAYTWTTEYSSSAVSNPTIDRIGKGYHGVTETLDFGAYNYILFEDMYVHYEYTVDEATMGEAHVTHTGATSIFHRGSRARIASGRIIRPSETDYGISQGIEAKASQVLYRNPSNVLTIATTTTYGIGITTVDSTTNSTTTIKPNYFNIRLPSFLVRTNSSYMTANAFNKLDWEATTLNFRCRTYRVPLEYGLTTQLYDRNLDVILDEEFPTE